ncbi:MAG: hypothetical protein ACTSPH_12260, partial [Promethearchaeota archaeon]
MSPAGSLTQWGGQSLGTGLDNSFDTLKLYLSASSGYVDVRICQADTLAGFYGSGSGDNLCPVAFTSTIRKYGGSDITSAGWYDFYFGEKTFLSNKFYLIDIYAYNNITIYGSSLDSSFVNGAGNESTFGAFGYLPNFSEFFRTYSSPVIDIAFQFSTSVSDSIDFIYPVDLSSLPNDFTTWKTKFSTIASGSYSIKIDYFDYS